jgi:hypothetical protein
MARPTVKRLGLRQPVGGVEHRSQIVEACYVDRCSPIRTPSYGPAVGGQKQLVSALLPVDELSAATEPDGAERVRLR